MKLLFCNLPLNTIVLNYFLDNMLSHIEICHSLIWNEDNNEFVLAALNEVFQCLSVDSLNQALRRIYMSFGANIYLAEPKYHSFIYQLFMRAIVVENLSEDEAVIVCWRSILSRENEKFYATYIHHSEVLRRHFGYLWDAAVNSNSGITLQMVEQEEVNVSFPEALIHRVAATTHRCGLMQGGDHFYHPRQYLRNYWRFYPSYNFASMEITRLIKRDEGNVRLSRFLSYMGEDLSRYLEKSISARELMIVQNNETANNLMSNADSKRKGLALTEILELLCWSIRCDNVACVKAFMNELSRRDHSLLRVFNYIENKYHFDGELQRGPAIYWFTLQWALIFSDNVEIYQEICSYNIRLLDDCSEMHFRMALFLRSEKLCDHILENMSRYDFKKKNKYIAIKYFPRDIFTRSVLAVACQYYPELLPKLIRYGAEFKYSEFKRTGVEFIDNLADKITKSKIVTIEPLSNIAYKHLRENLEAGFKWYQKLYGALDSENVDIALINKLMLTARKLPIIRAFELINFKYKGQTLAQLAMKCGLQDLLSEFEHLGLNKEQVVINGDNLITLEDLYGQPPVEPHEEDLDSNEFEMATIN